MRNFHFPGRSVVYGRKAMIATSHPAATLAGLEMLRKGGTAIDAAITATAVMCVVEPAMTGIGGDCFAIISKPGQKPVAMNASGMAPKGATPEFFAKLGLKSIAMQTAHAVSVPGAIDGWARLLKDYGKKSFAEVLAPAIEHAEKGFPVAPRVAFDWATLVDKIKAGNDGARQHLLKDGRAPRVGEIMTFPALAETLKTIAKEGRDGFYKGAVAADMVAELNALGGVHTVEDFAAQSSAYVDPISVRYKGVDLLEMPPNNQGIVALVMLKILERMGPLAGGPTSVERYHVMMEAVRLVFAMRDKFVADPLMAKVPVEHMLSDAFADELAKRIDRKARKPDLGPIPPPTGTDTIYMTVADESGMVVSFINSIFSGFGSGLASKKSGVVFHNRAQGFVLDPKHPNCIAPGKRPMHTLVPALAMKDGQPWMSFGVMGANFQPMGHVYMMTNVLDYGMDAQEALDNPRMFFEGEHLWCEDSVPVDVRNQLAAMGHPIKMRPDPWGGGQIIQYDRANGVLIGASDPRKDGMAMGY